jgi:hypothetical protein
MYCVAGHHPRVGPAEQAEAHLDAQPREVTTEEYGAFYKVQLN